MQENKEQELEIIFLGLAQNCQNFLNNFFSKIDQISKKKNIKVFIGENGSDDYTFDLIQKKISTNSIYNFVDTTHIEKYHDRIKRLAIARQTLKDKIDELNLNSKYVCVIDLDDVINESFSLNLMDKLIYLLNKNKDKYFGVSLNSRPYYYDILNFESEEFLNNNVKKIQNNKSIKSYKLRKNLFIIPKNY